MSFAHLPFALMMVWGLDLGVRSFAAAALDESGNLSLFSYAAVIKGKVADQPPTARGEELHSLSLALTPLLMPGDGVFVEEPPLAGTKNPRTFLKLAQSSAAVAVGARHGGASVTFVPVDTWKKETCGRGGAAKELVAAWLEQSHPAYFAQCGADQNLIDATCLAIYGAARPGRADSPQRGLAAS